MPQAMDNLTYHYLPNSNKLNHVDDATPASNYSVDIDDQDTLNYKYDNIGNLTSDAAEHISKIDGTVYGKIKSISNQKYFDQIESLDIAIFAKNTAQSSAILSVFLSAYFLRPTGTNS